MTDRKAQEGASRPVRSAPTAAESAFEDEGGALITSSVPPSRTGAVRSRRGERPRGGDSVPEMNAETSTVHDYMSSNVSPVRADTTLIEAAQQMRISGVGGVPVLDSRGEKCVGILTERDVVVRVLAEERDPCAAVVRDAATLQPVMCAPDDDIATALAQMREAEIQHLPVIARGRVVGVISLADVVFRRPDEERGTIVLPPVRSR
jgi:CBS domain-containing protein